MWRAWGIVLLALSPQDLGPRVVSPDHEFAIRPPSGWVRHLSSGPTLAKYTEPGDLKLPSEFLITHLYTSNPTPLESFQRQAKDNIKEKYPGSKILDEKELSVAGKRGYRIAFAFNEMVLLKTVVHRTNLEFYLLDAVFSSDRADKMRPLVESAIATLEIIPLPMSAEERLADGRTMAIIKNAKIDPALLGERWFAVVPLNGKKIGWVRFKMSESEGMYVFDSEVRIDFDDGKNTDTTVVRGSFSPDGRVQKVETEETKVNPKQKWVFKASAVNQGGQVKASRELNGVKEERSFTVEEGVLLNDIAEIMRTVLVGAGKGSYLLKTLSPYSEEWNIETIDVGGLESLEIEGKLQPCILVQAYANRRKNQTYVYAPDRSILRVGNLRDPFSIRARTKEEAQK